MILISVFCICVADHGYCKSCRHEIIQEKRVLSSEHSVKLVMSQKEKEGSTRELSTSALDNVFTKGVKNSDCVLILVNCLRSLEHR